MSLNDLLFKLHRRHIAIVNWQTVPDGRSRMSESPRAAILVFQLRNSKSASVGRRIRHTTILIIDERYDGSPTGG